MEFLNEELLRRIKGIQIRARYLVNDVFAGEYQSAFKGRGLEFEEVREYQPGDDVRSIDWNVTARTHRPFVKQYRDERELTVLFIVDASASVRFGSVAKFKNEIAAEVTALLAYTALRNNDKVGLIVFAEQVEHYLPPKKGRGHVWQLIRDIMTYQSKSRQTDFRVALDFLNRVVKKRSIAFLLSDFQGANYYRELRIAAKHHDLIAMVIRDPKELALPNIGYVELEDAETGECILVNTARAQTLLQYAKNARNQQRDLEDFFRGAGIDQVHLATDRSYLASIVQLFRRREKK